MAAGNVLGHYSVTLNGALQPLLPESAPLFRACITDDAPKVARLLDDGAASRVFDVLHWAQQSDADTEDASEAASTAGGGQEGSAAANGDSGAAKDGLAASTPAPRPIVAVKRMTLLGIACGQAAITGRTAVLQLLLRTPGCVQPSSAAGTGLSAFQVVAQAGGAHTEAVLALLQATVDRLGGEAAAVDGATAGGAPPMASATSSSTSSSSSLDAPPAAAAEFAQRLQSSSATGRALDGGASINGGGASASLAPAAPLPSAPAASASHSNDNGATARGAPSVTHSDAGGLQLAVDLQHHLSLPPPIEDAGGDTFHGCNDGLPYSTAELTQPEYSTDDFRMFAFKVLRCSKRFAHDWRACLFSHPTENARRRDPRSFRYCALACPDYKQGFCVRGDLCHYAHGVFEAWLHPSRYRTQLCKDGANCHRPICFFAHSLSELRTPTFTWTPMACGDDMLSSPVAAATSMPGSSTAAVTGGPGGAAAGARLAGSAAQAVADNLAAAAAAASHRGGPGGKRGGDGGSGVAAPSAACHDDPGTVSAMAAGAMPPLAPGPAAAAMFGFTAPRMSNAFARRHGLNPKDNAMLNLQKIALQMHPGMAAQAGTTLPHDATSPAVTGGGGGRGIVAPSEGPGAVALAAMAPAGASGRGAGSMVADGGGGGGVAPWLGGGRSGSGSGGYTPMHAATMGTAAQHALPHAQQSPGALYGSGGATFAGGYYGGDGVAVVPPVAVGAFVGGMVSDGHSAPGSGAHAGGGGRTSESGGSSHGNTTPQPFAAAAAAGAVQQGHGGGSNGAFGAGGPLPPAARQGPYPHTSGGNPHVSKGNARGQQRDGPPAKHPQHQHAMHGMGVSGGSAAAGPAAFGGVSHTYGVAGGMMSSGGGHYNGGNMYGSAGFNAPPAPGYSAGASDAVGGAGSPHSSLHNHHHLSDGCATATGAIASPLAPPPLHHQLQQQHPHPSGHYPSVAAPPPPMHHHVHHPHSLPPGHHHAYVSNPAAMAALNHHLASLTMQHPSPAAVYGHGGVMPPAGLMGGGAVFGGAPAVQGGGGAGAPTHHHHNMAPPHRAHAAAGGGRAASQHSPAHMPRQPHEVTAG